MKKIFKGKSIVLKKEDVKNSDQSQEEPNKEKKVLHRKKHKNSRLGCSQCRRRRVKCDETLPSCKKCSSRLIRCGYLDLTPHEVETIIQAHIYAETETGIIDSRNKQAPIKSSNSKINLSFQTCYQDSQTQQQINKEVILSKTIDNHNYHHNLSKVSFLHLGSINKFQDSYINDPLDILKFNKEESKPTTARQLIEEYLHPIYRFSLLYDLELKSPIPIDHQIITTTSTTSAIIKNNINKSSENKISSPNYNNITKTFEIPLIPHKKNKPQYDLKKFRPYFNETVPATFTRVFLLTDMFNILEDGMKFLNVFKVAIIFGAGKVLAHHSEIVKIFLKWRGDSINYLRKDLSDINDVNARSILRITTLLNKSSIFFKNVSLKEFFSFASGPCAVLRAIYENPYAFPKSLPDIKIFADGLLFTSKYIWLPKYDSSILIEFHKIFKEFGMYYIENEDNYNSDDIIHHQYISLVEFIEFAMELIKSQESSQTIPTYPIDKLFKLVKHWYSIVPSEIFSFGSTTSPIERIFYVFWHTLVEILDVILVGTRYIFSFFLNGVILIHTFDKEKILSDLNDPKLEWYLHYNCRIISFFIRRRAFVLRNVVLNDPTPKFVNIKDRLKVRSPDIHKCCITNFKTTVIKRIHYAFQSSISTNINYRNKDYYKIRNENDTKELSKGFNDLGTYGEDFEDVITKYRFNPQTSLLEVDYDPRFTDPIYNEFLHFQSADLEFIDRYIEDRKIIIKTADSY